MTHENQDGSVGPALAKSWQYIGQGNKEFELTLRDDARFSDGTPVTADSVKKWLDYYSGAKGPNANWIKISSIQAIANDKVHISLSDQNPILPELLSDQWTWGALASDKAVANPASLLEESFGAGPYVLVPSETVAGDHYTYVPNQYYYDQTKIRYQKIVARVIGNANSMLQAAASGQVQVATGDPSTAAVAANDGLSVFNKPGGTAELVFMDVDGKLSPALADVRVRQALNYAVDRKSIMSALIGGYGSAASVHMTSDGAEPQYNDYYTYDPVKAKSLLSAAGYQNGFTLKVLTSAQWGTLGVPVMHAVAKYLQAVGITLDIVEAKDNSDWLQKLRSKEFSATGLPGDSLPMFITYPTFFAANSVLHPGGATDPILADMFKSGSISGDPSNVWKQMTTRITEQAYLMPLFASDKIWYASKAIGGVSFSSNALIPIATDWFTRS
ncbi:hypothetical protein HFP15_19210 [Amycolatopsis sp. K13G38]|uniref:Solute-binding protein family 5 domain-containing protein n=1 Tax=Amycolatopsis acididurans TaxID=2724524 RepID=A0ABX1J9K9_9PSEU|nr:ABC transporter substrate-binding protein [Amycolatopsis acididurans]NKQ55015.1 hypothetical protein [Amycolatopsis acididurans]